jgi:hypothetical protein
MAEGLQDAACLICFMTQAYQDSANCKLELKFAQQSGVRKNSHRKWQCSTMH